MAISPERAEGLKNSGNTGKIGFSEAYYEKGEGTICQIDKGRQKELTVRTEPIVQDSLHARLETGCPLKDSQS